MNGELLFFSRVHAQIIIPARLDSGRLPGKVLIELAGKTVLEHVWNNARRASLPGEPIIATDSPEVEAAARGFGARVVMTSERHRCGSERVAEVAAALDADPIINLQADELFVEAELLERLASLIADEPIDMATAVSPLEDARELSDPSLVKVVLDEAGRALYFSRSPIPHCHNGGCATTARVYGHVGVYAYRRSLLCEIYSRPPSPLELCEGLEQLRVLEAGRAIKAVVWPTRYLGLNTPLDLERVRQLLEQPRN